MAVSYENCSEDVGALVFDIGSNSMKVGYSQEDSPKPEIPSVIGIGKEIQDVTNGIELLDIDINNLILNESPPKPKEIYYFDTGSLYKPHPELELITFMDDGMIHDWDLFEKMLEYSYSKVLRSKSERHPVLFSEAPWNSKVNREKLTELMFEKFNVPAFYLANNAVLAAFANGKSNALVVDSGATHTTTVPVHDGHVIKEGIERSPIAGDYISLQCHKLLLDYDIDLTPSYMIKSKQAVKENERPKYVEKKFGYDINISWHDFMVKNLVQDFQATVLEISETKFDEKALPNLPGIKYEFPTGFNREFYSDRFKIPEVLFNPKMAHVPLGSMGSMALHVGKMVHSSIKACDADIRPALYGNILITGGNTCIKGFNQRLQKDLRERIPPSLRLKIINFNSITEKKYGAWIGGSILSSLGTFQQMWISKQEYEESGKNIVFEKCS